MNKKRTGPRAFRPGPEMEKRLEYAENVGLNVSEIINELLDKFGKKLIEEKARIIRQNLEAPVP